MFVRVLHFCLSPGGQTFLHARGDKHFYTQGGGQTFYIGVGGDNYDVDGEKKEDVSKANILAGEVSKLSQGARILRSP